MKTSITQHGRINSTATEHAHEGIAHRKLRDVIDIVRAARFPAEVERRAIAIFERLAAAEARVHRVPVAEIAFHEVGQVDAIVDVAGAVIGLHLLGVDRAYCSPLPCGRGTIHSAHGAYPSPSPATMELLRGTPTYSIDLEAEMVTPTGAAILTSLADFGQRPAMTADAIGYGCGRSDFPFPNVLRVSIGEAAATSPGQAGVAPAPDVVQVETNIDDMNPQLYEHVMERLFAAGALDVWMLGAQMKKGRPGTVLAALAAPERSDAVAAVMLAETTTIGVRTWPAQRVVLPRAEENVMTSLGPVRVKIVQAPSGARARPEFDDCRAIAQRTGMALGDVMRAVDADVEAWMKQRS